MEPLPVEADASHEDWLFLAVVIKLFNRQVLGQSLREDMSSRIVIDTLRMATFKRPPDKHAEVPFHSDRGSLACISQIHLVHPERAAQSKQAGS